MKDLSLRLRREAGVPDLLEVQEELLALQPGHSIRLQPKAGVLSENFMLEGAAIRLDTVASPAAVVVGAAEAAAENQA
jgi:hypothetical protein